MVAGSSAKNSTGESIPLDEHHIFLTSNDHAVLHHFQIHFNRPWSLLVIALPPICTLVLCPVMLFLHPLLVHGFWPPDVFPETPNVNDVISSFLVPSGLVYAIAFGFAFQEAISKSSNVFLTVRDQLCSLDQILQLTKAIKCLNHGQRYCIYYSLKHETIQWMNNIMDIRDTQLKDTGNILWLFYHSLHSEKIL